MGIPIDERAEATKTAHTAVEPDARERWFVPPRLRTAAEGLEPRRASWLELFFDLVFVVAIAELSHQLAVDHSAGGFLRFVGLFIPVFVAWQGYSAYADRFDTDDLVIRVAYFVAMLAIAAMAVLISDVAQDSKSAAFAVAYVILRSVMVGLYWRAWRSTPEARPLIRRYGGGYSLAVALWLASLAVATPGRYAMWGVALAFELSLPPLSTRIHRLVPTHGSHLPERFALFTLIVLGESVVAVALRTAGANWRLASVAAAILGFTAVAAVWWLYYDRQGDVVLRGSRESVVLYAYAHIPLLVGLGAMSAGVSLLIARASEHRLGVGASVALLGGVALFLASLVGTRAVALGGFRGLGAVLKLGAAALIVALIAAERVLPPVALAGALVAILAASVYAERVLLPSTDFS
jgi:low temperature requirement protein LtrA